MSAGGAHSRLHGHRLSVWLPLHSDGMTHGGVDLCDLCHPYGQRVGGIHRHSCPASATEAVYAPCTHSMTHTIFMEQQQQPVTSTLGFVHGPHNHRGAQATASQHALTAAFFPLLLGRSWSCFSCWLEGLASRSNPTSVQPLACQVTSQPGKTTGSRISPDMQQHNHQGTTGRK